ncbi:MAG: carboxymuconolactone decarboxylase family protein [Woeseiaceae bacterium]|nr:carboxymuconolactone decarboxylase family protein [Woeseiaceae bacterium]
MAHLDPLSPEEVADDIRERFDHYRKTRGFTPNSIMTMARRPNIVRAFMQLNQAVLYEGTVDEELKMLVSLIASQVAGCRYCQAHMANLSKIYRASENKIARVWDYESSDLFTPAERAALRLAYHAAMAPAEATREHFDEAAKYFDEGQIVEIVASVALFGFLNRWNDTMATDIEDLPASVAEATLGASFSWERGKHAGTAGGS